MAELKCGTYVDDAQTRPAYIEWFPLTIPNVAAGLARSVLLFLYGIGHQNISLKNKGRPEERPLVMRR